MHIISTAIIKGGAGKTTTAAAIAQAAKKSRKKVLCVDLDPQANFTAFMDADPNTPGAFELIEGAEDPGQLIQTTTQGIDIIPASPNLSALKTKPGSAKRLQTALKPINNNYDVAIIDTPPQIGELTFNALQASTALLIPLETDNSSLQGLYQILDIAGQIKNGSNPNLSFIGVLLTRYDSRPNINRFLRDTIADTTKEAGAFYLGEIRAGVAIREAQAMRQSLFDYAPHSKPAKDYLSLFNTIKKKL